MATYASKSTVNGWLLPDVGLIRATASTQGQVLALLVTEGETVSKGTRIAEIGLSSETANGNLSEVLAKGLDGEAEALKAKGAAQTARLTAVRQDATARIEAIDQELEQVRNSGRSPANAGGTCVRTGFQI